MAIDPLSKWKRYRWTYLVLPEDSTDQPGWASAGMDDVSRIGWVKWVLWIGLAIGTALALGQL